LEYWPRKKIYPNKTTEGVSKIIQPSLLGMEGPHPRLLNFPYGAEILDSKKKVKNAHTKIKITSFW
jgi:hypothetical protein